MQELESVKDLQAKIAEEELEEEEEEEDEDTDGED